MKIWYNNVLDSDRQVVEIKSNRIRIGRSPHNELILDSPYIADEAAVLYKRSGVWELVVLGLNGVKVGEEQLFDGDRREILTNESISIFPFSLTLDLPKIEQLSQSQKRADLDDRMSNVIRDVHLELLQRIDLDIDRNKEQRNSDEYQLTLERTLDTIASNHPLLRAPDGKLQDHISGHAVRDRLLSSLSIQSDTQPTDGLVTDRRWSRLISAVPERETELDRTADYMSRVLETSETQDLSERIDAVEQGFWNAWEAISEGFHKDQKKYLTLRFLKKEIKDIVFGYGPLEDLLRLPTISEIMVVDRNHTYIERNGVLENSGRRFISDAVIESIISRIVSKVGRRIDKSQPLVDARLADGSRVNAVIAPLAVSGPSITIRKFPFRKLLIDDLVSRGAMTRTVAEFLRASVLVRKNVLISGGTGTGKTTLLNCLSDFIPDKERIVTIEDTAELQLNKEHVVRLETKDKNIEGEGEYTIRDLVRNALRMRPDRIVVGECRGPEALDMLQAMNTGHDGSMTTIHANNARDVLLRLEVLVQMAADLPISSIHQQIASAIDVIVQLKRHRDGRRVVGQITEVVGIDPNTGRIETRDLFLWEDSGEDDSRLQATGRLPTFIGQLIESGMLRINSFYE